MEIDQGHLHFHTGNPTELDFLRRMLTLAKRKPEDVQEATALIGFDVSPDSISSDTLRGIFNAAAEAHINMVRQLGGNVVALDGVEIDLNTSARSGGTAIVLQPYFAGLAITTAFDIFDETAETAQVRHLNLPTPDEALVDEETEDLSPLELMQWEEDNRKDALALTALALEVIEEVGRHYTT